MNKRDPHITAVSPTDSSRAIKKKNTELIDDVGKKEKKNLS